MIRKSTQEFKHKNQSAIVGKTTLQKGEHESKCNNNVERMWMKNEMLQHCWECVYKNPNTRLECHNFEKWTRLKVLGRRKEMKTKRHFATHVMKGVVFFKCCNFDNICEYVMILLMLCQKYGGTKHSISIKYL